MDEQRDHGAGDLSERICDRCRELGFALVGIARAETIAHPRALLEWLDSGQHGDMEWMEEHVAQRIDPRKMLPGARAVIVAADRYSSGEPDEAGDEKGFGRIARYARGGDYHRAMKKRLQRLADELRAAHAQEHFRVCVDTAPLLEREHAQRAGIGYIGKNTMLIEPGVGSYLLLGEILTTLPLEPNRQTLGDHCGTCTACIDACPTDAITPWNVDARRCISYLTIEHRGSIDEQWWGGMGDWVFGCDICQEVCPHNGDKPATRLAPTHAEYAERRSGFDLLELLGWDEEARQQAFARSALKRAKLAMMKRNALIAAGNRLARVADAALTERIRQVATDAAEAQMVRETAQRVLERLLKD